MGVKSDPTVKSGACTLYMVNLSKMVVVNKIHYYDLAVPQ